MAILKAEGKTFPTQTQVLIVGAVLLRGERGDGAAGAGADDEHLGVSRELPAFGLKDRHFYFDIRLGSQVIISGKIT